MRWPRPGTARRGSWAWRMTWRSSCPVPGRRSGPGCCGCPRPRSSPGRPRTWTPARPGRRRRGGLRAAITRAVLDIAPDEAVKRREEGRLAARVQRWREDSGNAALMGRELPPAEVLAADQRISWWARQLKKAGLDGDMDVLRARAYLDLLLNKDSRPAVPPAQPGAGQDSTDSQDSRSGAPGSGAPGEDRDDGEGPADGGPQAPHPAGPYVPPGASVLPAGFVGRLHLTVP